MARGLLLSTVFYGVSAPIHLTREKTAGCACSSMVTVSKASLDTRTAFRLSLGLDHALGLSPSLLWGMRCFVGAECCGGNLVV